MQENTGLYNTDYDVYVAKPQNGKWLIKKSAYTENNNFFFAKLKLVMKLGSAQEPICINGLPQQDQKVRTLKKNEYINYKTINGC